MSVAVPSVDWWCNQVKRKRRKETTCHYRLWEVLWPSVVTSVLIPIFRLSWQNWKRCTMINVMYTSHWFVSISALLIFISSSWMTGRKYGEMQLWVTMSSKCLNLFLSWGKLLGTASKTSPPLSSNYFKAPQATPVKTSKSDKSNKSEASTAPPTPPTPAPCHEQPYLNVSPYPCHATCDAICNAFSDVSSINGNA